MLTPGISPCKIVLDSAHRLPPARCALFHTSPGEHPGIVRNDGLGTRILVIRGRSSSCFVAASRTSGRRAAAARYRPTVRVADPPARRAGPREADG